ncbi:uncharacterized protein [Porites lutea]|uniref:uncharacterized protein n=1 Tax=Porites lutea TaxID=51062 RepID=UPI003CC52C71
MTTNGYDDRFPITVPGRLLAVVAILVGTIMNALFIASITASLTVFVIDEAANPERSRKVGVVTGSMEYPLGMRMNGTKGMKCVSYPTRDALLQGLESQAIDGALIDILTVDSFKKELNDSDFEVVKVLPNTFHYGIILTGDARNLSKYFKEYLVNHPVELLLQEEEDSSAQPIAKPTDEIQTVSVIPFFETDNLLFKRTLLIIVTSLLICVLSGLSFHFIWLRLNPKQDEPRTQQKGPAAVKAELTQVLEEFHSRIKATYFTLKMKHRRELLQFRHRRSASMIVAKSYFKKGSSIPQQV